jgi:hypothetical protein
MQGVRQMSSPYLSIVVVSRNDDHGGNMMKRMELCLTSMIAMLEKYRVDSELICVEWLPPESRPLLADVFPWPKQGEYCSIRCVQVPASKVPGYAYSDDYAIRDLTPWNVGIRRARGEFVLSTVIDVMFSEPFFHLLRDRRLDAGQMYRLDRCDVDRGVLEVQGTQGQLEFCRSHIIDRHTLNPLKFLFKKHRLPVLHDKTPGDFMLFSRKRWELLHGFPEGILGGADNLLLYMAYFSGAKHVILKPPVFLYHIDHDSKWKTPSYLAARKALLRLRLPCQLVDIGARLYDSAVPTQSALDRKKLKLTSRSEIENILFDMREGRRALAFNTGNWGAGEAALPERQVR